MKVYLLYSFIIKFSFLLTSINGFDRINNGFKRLKESLPGRNQGAGAENEGAVGGINEVELMNIGDNSTEACNDFYSYACNLKVRNNQTLQEYLEDEKTWEILSITNILNEPDIGSRYDKLSMEKSWFKYCVDKKHSRQAGLDFLTSIVNETDGLRNTNIRDNNQSGKKNWQAVASTYARHFGESAFFHVSIQQKIISIERPTQWDILFLKDDGLINNIDLLFDNFFFDGTEEDLTETKRRLVNFINRMKSFQGYIFDSTDILNIEQLQERWSFIKWRPLLQDVGLKLNNLDKVLIEDRYLDLINDLLYNIEGDTIVNYIHLLHIMDEKVKLYWDTSLNNLSEFELSDLCFKRMPIKESIGSIIEKRNFLDRKILIREVFENLRKVFIREVHKSWLDNCYKNDALERLTNVKLTITDMQQVFSSNEVSYIFDVNFCSLENLMNFKKAQMEYSLTVYRNNQPKLKFDLISRKKRDLTFNVTFDHVANVIQIPVEQLLTPFFSSYKPIAWNYGHVATEISYKLAKLLDDAITRFPPHYPLRKKHQEKENCFYNSLKKHAKNEQISESVLPTNCFALKMSYKALNNVLNMQTRRWNEKLPTLQHLSGRQLFFTAFAAGDCQHPNFKDVINEQLRHSKGFAQAFECAPNSFMNPVEKCELWKSKSKATRLKTYAQQN